MIVLSDIVRTMVEGWSIANSLESPSNVVTAWLTEGPSQPAYQKLDHRWLLAGWASSRRVDWVVTIPIPMGLFLVGLMTSSGVPFVRQ